MTAPSYEVFERIDDLPNEDVRAEFEIDDREDEALA